MWFTFHESFFNLAEAQAESAVEPHRMTDTCRGGNGGGCGWEFGFSCCPARQPPSEIDNFIRAQGYGEQMVTVKGETNHSAEGKRLVSEGEASGFLKSHS